MTRLLSTAASLSVLLIGPSAIAQKAKPPAQPVAPTHADVAYDEHPRTVIDFWEAEGDGPRPLFVYIHGGGWIGGTKIFKQETQITQWLKQGVSVASVEYRLSPDIPLPAPVHDAARAIQFLRSKAEEWNIREDRIALTGGSAGACTSMWILLHDDLADPDSDDPIARESTRVAGAAVAGGQTAIDPKLIEPWLGKNGIAHGMIARAVGEASIEDALKNYDDHAELYHEFSPINHMSADDPPLYMSYGSDMSLPAKSAGHGIHHGLFGVKMKEAADAAGTECHLQISGASASETYKNSDEFLEAILLAD